MKNKSLQSILELLKLEKDLLKKDFGVDEIAIFGSYARHEEKSQSDLDIMVLLKEGYSTFDNYLELQFYLEDILEIKIDLITQRSIRKELKESILKEAVYV